MIVESMTHAEVYKELEREREAVTTWWRCNLAKQRRRVLKSTHFPLSLLFDYTSARKNRYLFFTRLFDKKMKRILTGIAVPRLMKDGRYVYTSWVADQKLILPMVLIANRPKWEFMSSGCASVSEMIPMPALPLNSSNSCSNFVRKCELEIL